MIEFNKDKFISFCKEQELDWRKGLFKENKEKLVMWINFENLDTFTDLVGDSYFSNRGIESNLQHKQVAFNLVPICKYLNVEPNDILKKD
jgi:hypothetical protein